MDGISEPAEMNENPIKGVLAVGSMIDSYENVTSSPPLSCFSLKLWRWHYRYQTWELHFSPGVLFHILPHRLHCETQFWFQNSEFGLFCFLGLLNLDQKVKKWLSCFVLFCFVLCASRQRICVSKLFTCAIKCLARLSFFPLLLAFHNYFAHTSQSSLRCFAVKIYF